MLYLCFDAGHELISLTISIGQNGRSMGEGLALCADIALLDLEFLECIGIRYVGPLQTLAATQNVVDRAAGFIKRLKDNLQVQRISHDAPPLRRGENLAVGLRCFGLFFQQSHNRAGTVRE